MRPILDDIVERKRVDVAARKHRIEPAPNVARKGVFREALSRPGARFILEAKRKSPSAGDLRPSLDAGSVVRAYQGIADAISVVVDGPFFGGSLALLSEIRALTQTPILCKDFVVDAYQVGEAAQLGADAILLMMSILDDDEARRCLAEAERHGIDTLVEVHDEQELDRALELGARTIGINHRSFRDLSVDLAVSERLAPRVPDDVLLVAESGIGSAADVELLAPRADAFLVGSSLMKSDDVRAAAAALVLGRVKVCGITHPDDLRRAQALGATHAGMVFAESPRRVDLARARALADATTLPLVGVFRDETIDVVVARAQALSLAAVQLHGAESSDYVAALRQALPRTTFIVRAIAVEVAGRQAVDADEPYADRLLFDARVGTRSGGMGVAFAWERVAQHPRLPSSWLAGGIGPDNAAVARAVGAYGLDVSSGVEGEVPGRKSPDKMAAFFESLRVPVRAERR